LPYWHVAHHTSVVDYDVSGNHVTPESSVNNCQSTQYYTPEERRLKFVEFEEWRLKNSDDGSGILCRNVGKILPDHTTVFMYKTLRKSVTTAPVREDVNFKTLIF
jgi:hypothetical protein